jgi:hypothetical protein
MDYEVTRSPERLTDEEVREVRRLLAERAAARQQAERQRADSQTIVDGLLVARKADAQPR